MYPLKEAFIRNFSTPYSLLQRHLVGEKDGKDEAGRMKHPHGLIMELTTSSFLPCVMDLQKVRHHPKSADIEGKKHVKLKVHNSKTPLPIVSICLLFTFGFVWKKMDVKTKNLNLCTPVGHSAVLLHSVVWILLCSQSHHYPAGQVIAGKQHHHCGQVCCGAS